MTRGQDELHPEREAPVIDDIIFVSILTRCAHDNSANVPSYSEDPTCVCHCLDRYYRLRSCSFGGLQDAGEIQRRLLMIMRGAILSLGLLLGHYTDLTTGSDASSPVTDAPTALKDDCVC
jgi:hypothetical protein